MGESPEKTHISFESWSEDRRQKSEDRSQRSEDRSRSIVHRMPYGKDRGLFSVTPFWLKKAASRRGRPMCLPKATTLDYPNSDTPYLP